MVVYSLDLPETYLLLGKWLHLVHFVSAIECIANHATDRIWFDKHSNKRHLEGTGEL